MKIQRQNSNPDPEQTTSALCTNENLTLIKKTATACISASLVAICLYFCFWNIDQSSISIHSDEVIHIRVTQEMWQDGRWWQPTHGGVPYYNKPPFKMWLTFIPLFLWGESNVSYRIVDSLAGLGIMLLTALLANRILKSKATALFSILVLLGNGTLIIGRHSIRRATQDAMLVFLVTLAMLSAWEMFWRFRKGKCEGYTSCINLGSWPILFGSATGLAVMTKSFAGFLPPVLVIALFALNAKLADIRRYWKAITTIVIFCLLIPSLYFVPHGLLVEKAFHYFATHELYSRVVTGVHNIDDTWYYFRALFQNNSIISSTLLTTSLIYGLYQSLLKKHHGFQFLLVWAILPILLYSLVPSRLPWYIAPTFPAMALLIGAFIADCCSMLISHFRARKLHWLRRTSVIFALAIILVLSAREITADVFKVGTKIQQLPQNRLTLDKVVEEIKQYSNNHPSSTRAIFYRHPIDIRATPKKGRFNIDGLYRRMLNPFAIEAESKEELSTLLQGNKSSFIIARLEDAKEILSMKQAVAYSVIPPSKIRRKSLLAVSHTKNIKMNGFRPIKEIINFGKSNNTVALYGLSNWKQMGDVDIQFINGSRAAVRLDGDPLRRMSGTSMKINLGYSAPYRKTGLTLNIYLNESLVASLRPIRNNLRTHEFQIPVNTWEPGLNTITFVAKLDDDYKIKDSEQLLMLNWLTISTKFNSRARK